MTDQFAAVIGLEVHAQLSTESKIFCSCRAKTQGNQSVSEILPNSHVCPVCAGHPGTLPVLNRKVVDYAMRAGLATHCEINRQSQFARKNYFYPDLPKGYQISQYDQPLCVRGWLEISTQTGLKRISIERIHLEEDAGKNLHRDGYSLVNLNRAGIPLIEIVSSPELGSPEEAGKYLRALHAVLTYLDICDGNMQEGNFRCDANVSIRPVGATALGTRAEIKNINSFRFVEKALDVEIKRQIALVRAGGKVIQETRTYDATKNVTVSMRSKEEAHDYRYFSDPDLIPIEVDPEWIEKVRQLLPELPDQKMKRYVHELGLSSYDAGVLTSSKDLALFFEEAVKILQGNAKGVANYLTGEVARLMNETGIALRESLLKPQHIAEVVRLSQKNIISSTAAKQIIAMAWKSGEEVSAIVKREGLEQVSELAALDPLIEKVIAAFPAQVAEYRSGKEKLLGFFVGQVMKETGGKANPGTLQELIKKKLSI